MAGIGSQASRLTKDFLLGSNGTTRMPKLVYGTAWKKERTADLVYTALKAGFRGIDTAAQPKHYDEAGVGKGFRKAVSEGLVKRGDVFIQTKFTPPGGQNEFKPYSMDAPLDERVHQSLQSSLKNFTIEGEEPYLDSVVIHSPLDTIDESMIVWKTLESYHPHIIRNIGISNVDIDTLEEIDELATVKPALVQNNFHPRTGFAYEIRDFCRRNNAIYQSFWTYSGNQKLADMKPTQIVAQGAGVDRVVAYYCLVLGLENVTILDGTTNEDHMKTDLEGIEKVGLWAEGEGAADWAKALEAFRKLIRDT